MNLDEAVAVWLYLQGSTWYGPAEQEAGKRAHEVLSKYARAAIKKVAEEP